jgi:transitional endoplasmic reticulum ATPase
MNYFNKKDIIDDKYEVLFFIHQTTYGWSYRVKSKQDGKVYMLKVYQKDKLLPHHFTEDSDLLEACIHKGLEHPNLSKYIEHKTIKHNGVELIYYVVGFISGETLQERMNREGEPSHTFAIDFFSGVLDAVNYLHTREVPVLHCDITPQNIMMDLSDNVMKPILFDFGLARYDGAKGAFFNRTQPSLYYCAPEVLNDSANVESDVFSLGALLYCLLCGSFPWNGEITNPNMDSEKFISDLLNSRNKKLRFNALESVDEHVRITVIKSLLPQVGTRFKSAEELKDALSKEIAVSVSDVETQERLQVVKRIPGLGFNKIAGMDKIKTMIQQDVIEPLLHPEKNKEYGIEPPNGVLFYGPPGCGKTFFAECLADEVGFNFIKVKPSDVGSMYVHGGQDKISQLFKDAKENAPTILFLDEMDAMIPSRDGSAGHHYESEVNEWLVQINNCSQNEVFIIGATNRLHKIDTAVLRSGRFDRKIHIPIPDEECRSALFKLQLGKRPKVLDEDLDYDLLAKKTVGFVCSDVTLIVNDGARLAAQKQVKIDNDIILNIISNTGPSVNENEIKEYNNELAEEQKRTPIGFLRPSANTEKQSTQQKILELEKEMHDAADKQDYARAAQIKVKIDKLKSS